LHAEQALLQSLLAEPLAGGQKGGQGSNGAAIRCVGSAVVRRCVNTLIRVLVTSKKPGLLRIHRPFFVAMRCLSGEQNIGEDRELISSTGARLG
jgi:hypothetical protein